MTSKLVYSGRSYIIISPFCPADNVNFYIEEELKGCIRCLIEIIKDYFDIILSLNKWNMVFRIYFLIYENIFQ